MMNKPERTSAAGEASAVAQAFSAQDAEAFRAALQRVIDSEAFAGARRMSAFLQFAGKAALEGRTEIDQYEIAEHVLHRHEDFNPLDDASVRKLASQVRSKLEEYFEGDGGAEPVVISLPRRSYIPRFRYRATEESTPEPRAEPANSPEPLPKGTRRFGWWQGAGALALLAAAVWLGIHWNPGQESAVRQSPVAVVIRTQRGDLRGKPLDVAADAVRVGPEMEPGEEAVVELSFTPESATQQAGVMALGDADHFVRFGQHFKDRAMLEQSYEVSAIPNQDRSHFLADPLGQFGRPRWFSLRRSGSRYEAFSSADGFGWTQFAPAVEVGGLPLNQRAALYAFNGRSDGPSSTAIFHAFRAGPAFHNRTDGPFNAEDFPHWRVDADCAADTGARLDGGALEVSFASSAVGCNWNFTRPVPEGDWSFAALVDFVPVSGSAAGLVVRGTGNGSINLSRRHFQSNTLTFERTHDEDQRISDFPGAPPVILRLDLRNDVFTASASRDGRNYVPVGERVRITGKRENMRIGIYAMIAHWTSKAPRPPVRFHWVQRLVEDPPSIDRAGFR
jgi:hypothetical protein